MAISTFSQSPIDWDFVQNPYPFYETARASGDLFLWKDYDRVCAVSHEAVNTLLRDRRWGRQIPEELRDNFPEHIRPFVELDRSGMLEREPPAHTRLRSLVVRAFTSRGIAALEPGISALANQLIDKFPDGEFDLLRCFGEVIPVIVITRLLGIPEDMANQLLQWSHDMVAMYQAKRDREIEDKAVVATTEFSNYIERHIDYRRNNPTDDLISQLISVENEGEKLSTKELISTCILLLNAGHEATVHAIGNGVKSILESNWNTKELFEQKTIEATVEEILRFDLPLHKFERYAYEDMHMFGYDFKRGEQVVLLLAAANRDPTVFSNPATFDPYRTSKQHLALGAGIHFCVGAPLARMELSISLPILFRRCPNIEISQIPQYSDRYHFHGLTELIIGH